MNTNLYPAVLLTELATLTYVLCQEYQDLGVNWLGEQVQRVNAKLVTSKCIIAHCNV